MWCLLAYSARRHHVFGTLAFGEVMYRASVLGADVALGEEIARAILGVGWRCRWGRAWDQPLREEGAIWSQVEDVVVALDDSASVVEAMRGCNYVIFDLVGSWAQRPDVGAQVERLRLICEGLRAAQADKLVILSSVGALTLGPGEAMVDGQWAYVPQAQPSSRRALEAQCRSALSVIEREVWRYAADALSVCVVNVGAPVWSAAQPVCLAPGALQVGAIEVGALAMGLVKAALHGRPGARYLLSACHVLPAELGAVVSAEALAEDEAVCLAVAMYQALASMVEGPLDVTLARQELGLAPVAAWAQLFR